MIGIGKAGFVIGLFCAASASVALADLRGDVVPPVRWNDKQAAEQRWTPVEFDLGPPNLIFRTYLPKDATTESIHLPDQPASENLGRMIIAGKYTIPVPGEVIDGSIVAYELRYTGSAQRLCVFAVTSAGYGMRAVDAAADGTHTQILSFRPGPDGTPNEIAFSDCRTRGHTILAQHFLRPIPAEATLDDLEVLAKDTAERLAPVIGNIRFTDGRADGYAEAAEMVPLVINGTRSELPVPTAFEVVFNDFDGRTGLKELYLLHQPDKIVRNLVWMVSSPAPTEPPIEASLELLTQQFMLQTNDVLSLEPASQVTTSMPDWASVAAKTIRYDVKDKDGQQAGTLDAVIVWNDGQAYVMSWFSNYGDDGSANAMTSRLPGQTVVDLLTRKIQAATP
ncbi:hypothetical protein JJJ17_15730 [Paracoccus caeni]|uniref:Beta-lactamase enzyme family protein n=1 Tax=Paracoccus caeni TaxID=657651 RepID=A0A934SN47_9RHOB|nr:hypothetical protein [Paracoccus caeni]MBK4217378.1 hypothetical protein [Paracoccus caeni]